MGSGGTFAERLGELGEVTSGMEAGFNIVYLGFGGRHLFAFSGAAGGDQNLAEVNAFGLRVVLLVFLVKALGLAGSKANALSDFLPHHFLSDDSIADILLEVFK